MDELSIRRAQKYLKEGLLAVSAGQFEKALELFKESSKNQATADAFTYWAWMEHHRGHTNLAIHLCHKAIELDPDFGNPYNDIGSYLIALGNFEEAKQWLLRAMEAKRYEPKQFPHLNLGRIYLTENRLHDALEQFQLASHYSPDDIEIKNVVQTLEEKLRGIERPR